MTNPLSRMAATDLTVQHSHGSGLPCHTRCRRWGMPFWPTDAERAASAALLSEQEAEHDWRPLASPPVAAVTGQQRHVMTDYTCVGVSRRLLGTHIHQCTCGWRSVEHNGTDLADCEFTDQPCPDSVRTAA